MNRIGNLALAALACGTLLLGACGRDTQPQTRTESQPQTQPKTEWIDPAKVQPGPIRRERLSDEQMARVRRVQEVFAEVDPTPLDKWVEDFRRDLDPDRELAIWERMAAAYTGYTAARRLTPEAKKEVFVVLLLRSGAPEEEVLKQLKPKVLGVQDARDIMRLYSAPPQPAELGR